VSHSVPCLSDRLLSHGPLWQRHPKGEPIPLSTVTSYVTQIADALQHAHSQIRWMGYFQVGIVGQITQALAM
jgi:hypothetical protein